MIRVIGPLLFVILLESEGSTFSKQYLNDAKYLFVQNRNISPKLKISGNYQNALTTKKVVYKIGSG